MRIKITFFPSIPLSLILCCLNLSLSQAQPDTRNGFQCNSTQASYPCQTYVFYRAQSPDFLDLATIANLFSVSGPTIARTSNISNTANPLLPDESLFVPIDCVCNFMYSTFGNISYSGQNYTVQSGDTFWKVSTFNYQNLTTYTSVEVVNPTLDPTQINIGDNVVFPIFCKCPNSTQLQNGENFLITYKYLPGDNLTSVASKFGTTPQAIVDVNGNNISAFDTVFVPVSRLPNIAQPIDPLTQSGDDRKGQVIGLGIGLGICGLLLILVLVVWIQRESLVNKKLAKEKAGKRKRSGETAS